MIVPAQVEDDLGAPAKPTTTFLRYEVTLGFERPVSAGSLGRLSLLGEELRHIRRGEAAHHIRFDHSAKRFRSAVIRGERRGGAFLSTEHREGGTVPTALRTPDGLADPRMLGVDGRHLAATLYRMANGPNDGQTNMDPEAVYARVAGRLADLSGVGVEGLTVELDPVREVFTLFLQERGDLRLPARALSEGTLRFLALCVLLEDPTFTGLIAMEEPENGIHPANLPAMVELVRDLAVDPSDAPDDDNPFRQVIVHTHSPGVVQLCRGDDLLLAEVRARRTADGGIARALSLLPFHGSWRAKPGEPAFSEADVVAFLAAPPGAQLRLPPAEPVTSTRSGAKAG